MHRGGRRQERTGSPFLPPGSAAGRPPTPDTPSPGPPPGSHPFPSLPTVPSPTCLLPSRLPPLPPASPSSSPGLPACLLLPNHVLGHPAAQRSSAEPAGPRSRCLPPARPPSAQGNDPKFRRRAPTRGCCDTLGGRRGGLIAVVGMAVIPLKCGRWAGMDPHCLPSWTFVSCHLAVSKLD